MWWRLGSGTCARDAEISGAVVKDEWSFQGKATHQFPFGSAWTGSVSSLSCRKRRAHLMIGTAAAGPLPTSHPLPPGHRATAALASHGPGLPRVFFFSSEARDGKQNHHRMKDGGRGSGGRGLGGGCPVKSICRSTNRKGPGGGGGRLAP